MLLTFWRRLIVDFRRVAGPAIFVSNGSTVSTTEERSYIEAARREKRAELERLGVPAYAYRYERSHTAAAALAEYQDEMGEAGPKVRIAGRINRLGSHGKTTFGHVEDPSGRIQV